MKSSFVNEQKIGKLLSRDRIKKRSKKYFELLRMDGIIYL